jgi:transcription elongation factor Elf1
MKETLARRRALERFLSEHGRSDPDSRHVVATCPRCGSVEVEFDAVRLPGGRYRVVCRHCVAIVRAAA